MADSDPDPTSQINTRHNTGPIKGSSPLNNSGQGPYNAQQCQQNAPFLNGLTYCAALIMWIQFFIFLQPCLLFVSGLITTKAQQARGQLRGGRRPFFGKIEKLFLASTVTFGLEALFVIILGLLVQVQRYCGYSFHMTEGAYVVEWIITALLGAAALGTTALFWLNSAMALKGREPAVRNYRFVEIEVYILASPLILIGLLLILAIKGPNACRVVKVVKSIQERRIVRQNSTSSQQQGGTVMGRLKAWRKGKNRGSNGVDAIENGVDLESPLMPKQAEQQAPPP